MSRPGFLRRSLDALRSQSKSLKLDPEHYSAVLPMVTFPTPESILHNCALGSDNDTGGYTTASLDHVVEDGIPCLRFSGSLSLHVSPEARRRGMSHSGWAGWRTRPLGATIFNRHPMWDTSLFRFLSLKVKGDDRRYYINVQTDSLDPIELWQHRLFLQTPGKWETVLIPWGDFLRTRNGRITYKKFDGMDRERVKTVGASLLERKEGPFCLHVAEVKSVNTPGFHGPFQRYTKEDVDRFIAEETARNAEEVAAYYAWKRGDTPMGAPPPEYHPPEPTDERQPDQSQITDDLYDEGLSKQIAAEKVDIDTVDVDDQTPKGRVRRMEAMAKELEGFSIGQQKEAEKRENERIQENLREGRKIMDHFGQRFEEPPSRRR